MCAPNRVANLFLCPISTAGEWNAEPTTGLCEANVGEAVLLGQLLHGLRPDLLVQLVPCHARRVRRHSQICRFRHLRTTARSRQTASEGRCDCSAMSSAKDGGNGARADTEIH